MGRVGVRGFPPARKDDMGAGMTRGRRENDGCVCKREA